jgi:photosystem II stability/assembly factor-like uncharacterized protein
MLNSISMPTPSFGVIVGVTSSIYMTHDGGAIWGFEHGRYPNSLNATSFLDSLHGFIVGSPPIIVRTTNGGVIWTSSDSVATIFFGVGFANERRGVACGTTGTIAQTTDGGGRWAVESTDLPITLYSVCAIDSVTYVAVGLGGTAVKILTCTN